MLLAVIGPRFSGKKEIRNYYVSVHGFVSVHILNQQLAPSAPDDQFKVIGARSPSPVGNDEVSSPQAVVTTPPIPCQSEIPTGQALNFSTAAALLRYVTVNWRQNFVTTDLCTRTLVGLFVRRPFFMLLSVEAPLTTRFLRSGEKSLEKFVQEDDRATFGVEISDSTIISDSPQQDPSCLLNLRDMVNAHVINSFTTLRGLHEHLASLDLMNPEHLRPGWDAYFMTLASLASQRSNCMKRRVGAVLVRENRVVSTGYNGTPRGLPNCNEGGCSTCNGTALTPETRIECVCLHAEENALLEAGRERVGTNAVLYCNTCPCLKCTIKIIQTGVKAVVYNLAYKVDDMSASLFHEAGVELRRYNPQKEFRWFPGDHVST
ncbi:putative cytidine and deoxycytidylate deaminase zinc-binding region [Lyophyllum shimeji]|uniref:Deoxycytidylate deaminase n=1 Tax=Lyophyllum shimeji TaxID=47721 RepID=A0A9P3UJP9_LYOSH|nr:putative cytidine and deoxycytidylate deaminase zinc-binding region [Lyophyllum shimeji]